MGYTVSASSYLKSGEFARFCNTTKETLRHYRDEGLLVPAFKGDNGYLYYSPLQVSDFMLISALAKAGSSLREIKNYLHDPESDQLETLIECNIEQIRSKRASLLRQQRLLERTLARKRELEGWLRSGQRWRVVEEKEERFLSIDLSPLFDEALDQSHAEEQVQDLLEYMVQNLNHNNVGEIQSVYRIDERALEAGTPALGYSLCFRVPSSFKRSKGFLKPAGRYFQMLRPINVEEMLDSDEDLFRPYVEFFDAVKHHGFSPKGDLFEQELSLYGGDISDTFYSRLSIRID